MTPRVREAPTRAAQVIEDHKSVAAAARAMITAGVNALVALRKGRLVGMVYAADVDAVRPSRATTLTAYGITSELGRIPVAAIARPIRAVTPRTPLVEAARLLRDADVQALPVVNGDAVVGILTAADVLDWTFHNLPR